MATKYENYSGPGNFGVQVYGNYWRGQTFTPSTTHEIQEVWLEIRKVNSPGDDLYIEIQGVDGSSHPDGSAIASGSNDGSTWNSSYVLRKITLSSTGTVNAGTEYAIVIKSPSSDSSNHYQFTFDNTSATYAGGFYVTSTNGGSSWGDNSTADTIFEEWGTASASYTSVGSPFLFTEANWDVSDVFFEIFFKATTGTVFARLYDVTAADSVAGTIQSTASTILKRYRTASISANLSDGHEYRVQFGTSGSDAGEYVGAKLVMQVSDVGGGGGGGDVSTVSQALSQTDSRVLVLESEMSQVQSDLLVEKSTVNDVSEALSQADSRVLVLESEMSQVESAHDALASEVKSISTTYIVEYSMLEQVT